MRRNASAALLSIGTAIALLLPIVASAAGPPFPEPVEGQAVYDNAGILSDRPSRTPRRRSTRSRRGPGAEIVVYTQLVDYGVTTEETEARARALIDQWGVGRRGFDDGLAIFFDIDPSLEHGQVQLYAAPGFEATFLTNSRAPGDLRRRHDPVPPERRLRRRARRRAREGRRRRHARERRPSPDGPPDQRGPRPRRRAGRASWAWPGGPSSTGAASARTRSTSTTPRSSCRRRRPT